MIISNLLFTTFNSYHPSMAVMSCHETILISYDTNYESMSTKSLKKYMKVAGISKIYWSLVK